MLWGLFVLTLLIIAYLRWLVFLFFLFCCFFSFYCLLFLLTYYHVFYVHGWQISLALLNARVSTKSFNLWSAPVLLPLISLMLSKFSLIVPLVCIPSCYMLSMSSVLLSQFLFFLVTEHCAGNPFPASAGPTFYYQLFWWLEIWYADNFWGVCSFH